MRLLVGVLLTILATGCAEQQRRWDEFMIARERSWYNSPARVTCRASYGGRTVTCL